MKQNNEDNKSWLFSIFLGIALFFAIQTVFCSIIGVYDKNWSLVITNEQASPITYAIMSAFLRLPRDIYISIKALWKNLNFSIPNPQSPIPNPSKRSPKPLGN